MLDDPHRRHLALTLFVAAGLLVYLTGSVVTFQGFDLALLLTLLGGFPIYFEALSGLLRLKISAALAVSLAAFAALWIGQFAVAAEVILIMLIGETLEHFAIDRTRSGIAALLALRPEQARVRRQHEHEQEHEREQGHPHEHVVAVEEIRADDIVLVRPGDRIPVDGRVIEGHSTVDQSPITGESMPADKMLGDEVFAGTINLYGSMELAVERLGHDTTLEQIIHLIERAEAAKAPTEKLADRFATWFVPIVLVVAGGTYYFTGEVVRAVSVLVVACPCALVLATPTAVAAGLGAMVRRGVLIKGGSILERLGRLQAVVFDKTGTLTLAKLRISKIVPARDFDEAGLLRLAATVEQKSEHPVGRLIVDRAREQQITLAEPTDFVARPGLGAEAIIDGQLVRVGSPRFLEQAGIELTPARKKRLDKLSGTGATVVLIARGHSLIGAVAVEDTVRPEAQAAVRQLGELGIRHIAMLTGDNESAAQTMADIVGIEQVEAGLLPADKVDSIRRLRKRAAPVAMIGDGINDAPSLVAADVGLAMADIGTDVAIASADVVLIGDDLRKLSDAILCGRRMLKIIWQNILGFAMVFNVLAVIAACMGWITPVMAAVLHQVSSLTVVLNSLRLLVDIRAIRSWLAVRRHAIFHKRRRILATGIVLAATVYLASGLHRVKLGEVAVVQHFGQITDPFEPPGLHYRLPVPFGRHQCVNPDEIRRVEIGYRTVAGVFAPPSATEWNLQHRGGGREARSDEAAVWIGDENLADVNLTVHYRVTDPLAALFHVGLDRPTWTARLSKRIRSLAGFFSPPGDSIIDESKWDILVRDVAESCLRAELSQGEVDGLLSTERSSIEMAVHGRIARTLLDYETGFVVEAVCLGDVHPPLEVVPAFRKVAIEQEGKDEKINRADAYQARTEAVARGRARQDILTAEAWGEDAVERATGAATRFVDLADACRKAPEVTRLRLHLETVEKSLAGRRKVIVDRASGGARRQIFLGRPGSWIPTISTRSEDTP